MCLFCWTQRKIFWRMWKTKKFWGTIDFHSIFFPTMEVNGAKNSVDNKLSSKCLPLCSAEQRNSYRFGMTRGWVNLEWLEGDRIFIFGWTIPLSTKVNWMDYFFINILKTSSNTLGVQTPNPYYRYGFIFAYESCQLFLYLKLKLRNITAKNHVC